MKRTQLYVDEDVWKVLQMRARQAHTSISELVRKAVRERYLDSPTHRQAALLAAVGLWKDRTDIPESQEYVRRVRKGLRLERLRK